MKGQSLCNKLNIMLLLLILMGGSVFAFPHSALGGAGQTPPSSLTVAGQSRQCSQYADETGTFIGSKVINSKTLPALVNIYYVNSNGGWTYYNEFQAPVQFTGGNRMYAYEVYYCPVQATSCSNGAARAVTETTYQTCQSGSWGATQQCPTFTYFSPSTSSCVTTACMERWTCSQWGTCTASGQQFRTCTDLNACGTTKDQTQATSQSCTPTASQGSTVQGNVVVPGTTGDGLKIVGLPKLDLYTSFDGTHAVANEPRTVTQTFNVIVPGQYWVEAGIEQMRGFDITAAVEHNTCNPDETWYANQLVNFPSAGAQTVTFTVTPATDGEYVLHTAIVSGCGGSVTSQVNAADHLYVGNPSSGKGSLGGWFNGNLGLVLIILGVLLLIGGGIWYFVKRR